MICSPFRAPNSCDWSATGSMLSGIGQIASAIATLIGAAAVIWAAHIGKSKYEDWRRQQVVSRRFDRAEQLMAAVYQAQAALKRIRRDLTPGEIIAAGELIPQRLHEQDPHGSYRYSQAYYTRLIAERDHRRNLLDQLPIAKAYFYGLHVEDKLNALAFQFDLLNVRVVELTQRELDGEASAELNRLLFSPHPLSTPPDEVPEDPFAEKVQQLVEELEAICLKDIRDGVATG